MLGTILEIDSSTVIIEPELPMSAARLYIDLGSDDLIIDPSDDEVQAVREALHGKTM